MNVLLMKLRGVVATGLIWGPVWAAMFAVLMSMIAIILPFQGDVGPMRMITIVGWVGLVSGGLFGIPCRLPRTGRRSAVSRCRVPRCGGLWARQCFRS